MVGQTLQAATGTDVWDMGGQWVGRWVWFMPFTHLSANEDGDALVAFSVTELVSFLFLI